VQEITNILKQVFSSRYTFSFFGGLISCSLFYILYFTPLPMPNWATREWQISRWKARRKAWKDAREHWVMKIISSVLMMGIVILFFKDYFNFTYFGCFLFVFVMISALIALEPSWAVIISLTGLFLASLLHFRILFRLEAFLLLIFLSLASFPFFFFGLKHLYRQKWLLKLFFPENGQKKKEEKKKK
jgi:hypothetical protein